MTTTFFKDMMTGMHQLCTTLRLSMAILFAIFTLSACTTQAQVKGPIEEIGGQAYYMHKVEKKQTLYSLSKFYKCDINAIMESNPGMSESLSEGQTVRIPAAKSSIEGQSIQKENGKSFVMREVQKKETLFSIAKEYGMDPNDIIAANPGVENGLKKGQIIRIPVKSTTPPPAPANTKKHQVAAGETLYSISKQYQTTVEEIQNLNGGLKDGLKAGMEILVPTTSANANEPKGTLPEKGTSKGVVIDGNIFEERYSVAMMLPFYTNYTDSMETRDKRLRDISLQIYRGATLATDSLAKMGLNADLYVYDLLDEKEKAKKLLEKSEVKNADLIIGPAFKSPLTEVAKWSADKGIHVACPVQQPNNVLLNSPNMSKVIPSSATMWVGLARYVYKQHKNDNIIIIDSKNIDDRRLVDAFREEWKKLSNDSIRNVVVVSDASNFKVSDKYVAGKKNIVISPTNDKKVIATLFKVLGEGDITVYGTDSWDDMDAINVANRNKYHVHYPQTVFINYNEPKTQRWIEAFRKKYKTEPSSYAVLGYDMMMYYGMGLKQFGKDFPNHFDDIKCRTVGSNFDFIKTSDEGGFENQFVIVIGTDNFELIREQ